MLNIKAPSQLYQESHAGNYAMVRSKGDELVNHALDSRLKRVSLDPKTINYCSNAKYVEREPRKRENIDTTRNRNTSVKKKYVACAKKAMRGSVKTETLKLKL